MRFIHINKDSDLSKRKLPTTLDELANTTIIYTTKLKVNGSQLARITNDFSKLQDQKSKLLDRTEATHKENIDNLIRHVYERYYSACEERRRILEDRQYDLEYLHKMFPFKYSNELAAAIDLQVEATKDLQVRFESNALRV